MGKILHKALSSYFTLWSLLAGTFVSVERWWMYIIKYNSVPPFVFKNVSGTFGMGRERCGIQIR